MKGYLAGGTPRERKLRLRLATRRTAVRRATQSPAKKKVQEAVAVGQGFVFRKLTLILVIEKKMTITMPLEQKGPNYFYCTVEKPDARRS